MTTDHLAAKKQELAELTEQLQQVLGKGLMLRLRDPTWYLTGVKVGLESLRSFYVISELVYREYTASSEGGRRLANMRYVYDRLVQFASPGQNVPSRTKTMLEIHQPLQLLLREWEGREDAGDRAQRKTIVGQLASDINLNLLRLRSFEKMTTTLIDLLHFKYIFLRSAKHKCIEHFRWQYTGYAKIFGFDDPDALYDKGYVNELIAVIKKEIGSLEGNAKKIWSGIYQGRFRDRASQDQRADLAEGKVLPTLKEVAQDGFDYLDRAYTAYLHALELAETDDTLFNRVGDLGAEISEAEVRTANPAAAQA